MTVRIVHYHQAVELSRGGVVRAVLDLAEATAARGHEVTLLTHSSADVPAAWAQAKPGEWTTRSVVDLGPQGWGGVLTRASIALAREAIRGADVVHLHTCWLPANDQLARVCARLGVPIVYSVHGMLDDWSMAQSSLRKRVYHLLRARGTYGRTAIVHTTAEGELKQARRWIGHARGAVVPLVVDTEPYLELPDASTAVDSVLGGVPPRAPSVLFLSRIHYKKGVDVLLRASAELAGRGVDHEVLIAGPGDERESERLCALSESLGVSERVRWLGPVFGEAKLALYGLADVFCLPTSQENFGLVLFESLACGTPLVTTPLVDTGPELESSGGAVLAERTPTAIAGALAGLLGDPERRRAMGEAGRAWVLRELSPERVISRYEAMYAEAIELGRGGA
ncbi:MAG: glycosyltransferase [Planctomycetota bacterium]